MKQAVFRAGICRATWSPMAFALGLPACGGLVATDELGVGSARQSAAVPETNTLGSAAAYAGRTVGTAVQNGALGEAAYANTLASQFTAVTPENETKWSFLQPDSPDVWEFAAADAVIDAAIANGQRIKGHTLVWHQQLPSWISEDMSEGQLRTAVVQHIKKVVKRYAGKVAAWDVVNEAVADDGSGLRDTIFLRKLGPDYIEFAFNYANAHDHDAILYYNDYGIETINPKSDAVYEMVQGLLANDVPIDGIGMQAHVSALSAPSVEALKANFQRFIDLGLSVNLSELDVRVSDVPGDRNRRLAVQKQVYHRIITACIETPGCDAVTTWGFTDKYSWIDSAYGPDDPLPFDDQYGEKPAFFAIVDGFVGVPPDGMEAAPNYVKNSSLEVGTRGWVTWGDASITTSTDRPHSGLRSALVTGRTGAWQGAVYDVAGQVRPGSFDASVYARVAGSSSEPVRLTAQIICAGTQDFVPVAEAVATDTDWVNLTGEVSVPDCQLDAMNLYVEGPAVDIDLFVDDFTLREQDSGLGPELVQNTTFETNLDWWFAWGSATVEQSNAKAHSGLGSAYISDRENGYDGLAINLLGSVDPGTTYQATGWALLDNVANAEVVLTAAATCDGQSTQFLRIGQAAATDSAWTKITGSVDVPDCTLSGFFFYVEGPEPGTNFYFDDPSFRAIMSNEGPNVLRNSDFETGTGWWFAWGPDTVEASSEAHGGLQSVIATNRTASYNGVAYDLLNNTNEPLVPGGSYELDAWASIAGTASSNVRFTTQHACDDGTGDHYTTVATAAATEGDWAHAIGGLSVPTCTLTKYFLYAEGPDAGIDLLVDDVYLRQQL